MGRQPGHRFFIGRRPGLLLSDCGFQQIAVHGETSLFNGGSLLARYLRLSMEELKPSLLATGRIGHTAWNEAMVLFDNPQCWSWQNSYVTSGRNPSNSRRLAPKASDDE